MTAREAVQELFGDYVSRSRDNLLKRCKELGWPESSIDEMVSRGWISKIMGIAGDKEYFTGHYERVCTSKLPN